MKQYQVEEPAALYSSEDGLTTPEIGSWGIHKYKLVSLYNELFSTGMKKKWDKRVYIDLFAGAGKARIKESGKVVLGSPLLALSAPDPFDRYIFCENNPELMEALRERVRRNFPEADVQFVSGDCNEQIDSILAEIPQRSKGLKVLTFCFVDPFSLNIHFNTIRTLASYRMDFLILLMLMDPMRNENRYMDENSDRIDLFLGLPDWRERWLNAKTQNMSFRKFLATEYAGQMASLGYRPEAINTMVEVRSEDKNLPLYYLSFFSKHELGYKFWKQVQKYSTDQLSLDLE